MDFVFGSRAARVARSDYECKWESAVQSATGHCGSARAEGDGGARTTTARGRHLRRRETQPVTGAKRTVAYIRARCIVVSMLATGGVSKVFEKFVDASRPIQAYG